MGSREEPPRLVVSGIDDRPVAGDPRWRWNHDHDLGCFIVNDDHPRHPGALDYDDFGWRIDANDGHDRNDDGVERCVTGVPRRVVLAGRGDRDVHERQDLRLCKDQSKWNAICRWSCPLAPGLRRKRANPALALRPYVEEDQEAQGAPAPFEGEPR